MPPPSACAATCAPGRNGELHVGHGPHIEVQRPRAWPTAHKEVHARHLLRHPAQRDLRHHRPGPIRQDLPAALPQPHHRLHAPRRAVSGTVHVDGEDVRAGEDVFGLRRKIGMVAPLPVGLPLSIYDNVAFAPRCAGMTPQERTRRPWSSNACARPRSGTKSRTASTASAPSSPAASSSA